MILFLKFWWHRYTKIIDYFCTQKHCYFFQTLSCAAVLMWMFANDSSNVAILDHSESGQHHTLSPKIFKSAGG